MYRLVLDHNSSLFLAALYIAVTGRLRLQDHCKGGLDLRAKRAKNILPIFVRYLAKLKISVTGSYGIEDLGLVGLILYASLSI